MKNNILLITLILGIWSCTNIPTASITVTLLADKTDSLIPKPNTLHLKSFFEDARYEDGVRNFRFQAITHTNVNESFRATIPASDPFGNSLQYKATVGKFYKRIDTLLASKNREKNTYQNSSILKPLLMQLKRIQVSGTTRKVVLLYSDLLEASDLFNVYRQQHQKLLLTNPGEVTQLIKPQLTIPDLEGVELCIIYYPTNSTNNRLFEKMTEVYQELFKSSGLKLTIGIDNKIQL